MGEKHAKEIQAVMDSIDTDKSGTINYTGNLPREYLSYY